MNAPLRQAERLGRLTTELGPDVLSLLRFDGTDHLNDLYEYQVEALAVRDDLDFDALVGAHATVEIEGREGVQHFGVRTRAARNRTLRPNGAGTSCSAEDSSRKSQWPEAFGHLLLGVPGIDAGEIYVLPAEWRDMLEQYVGDSSTTLTQMGYGTAEINGIPVDDGADDKVEARGTECLTFERSVADFAALMEENGPLELVGGFSFVKTGLTSPAKCRVGIPFDHKQGSLDAPELTQGFRQLARFRGCRQLFEDH